MSGAELTENVDVLLVTCVKSKGKSPAAAKVIPRLELQEETRSRQVPVVSTSFDPARDGPEILDGRFPTPHG
jgi:hypothetical protein